MFEGKGIPLDSIGNFETQSEQTELKKLLDEEYQQYYQGTLISWSNNTAQLQW